MPLPSYSSFPHPTRRAILRCAEHGAATSMTLTRMVYALQKRSARGNPNFGNAGSRIGAESARKRVARLVDAGVFVREGILFHRTPLATVRLNYDHVDLLAFRRPSGTALHGYVRSAVAADLAARQYIVGREPEIVELFFANGGTCAYRCSRCGTECAFTPRTCAADKTRCTPVPVYERADAKVTIDCDLFFKVDTAGRMLRGVVWVDDGSSLTEQIRALMPVVTECGRTAPLKELRIIVRPDDESLYSSETRSWATRGQRLEAIVARLGAIGVSVTAGGHEGHRYSC